MYGVAIQAIRSALPIVTTQDSKQVSMKDKLDSLGDFSKMSGTNGSMIEDWKFGDIKKKKAPSKEIVAA
jgi:hypothetical protein